MAIKKNETTTPMRNNEHFLTRNRNMRNELLSQTDYLMLVDNYEKLTAEQKEEIKTFRQTLREFINENKDKYLTDGNNFIEFPKPPEWVGTLDLPKY